MPGGKRKIPGVNTGASKRFANNQVLSFRALGPEAWHGRSRQVSHRARVLPMSDPLWTESFTWLQHAVALRDAAAYGRLCRLGSP